MGQARRQRRKFEREELEDKHGKGKRAFQNWSIWTLIWMILFWSAILGGLIAYAYYVKENH